MYVFIVLLIALAVYERTVGEKSLGPGAHWFGIFINCVLILLTANILMRWWFERLVADSEGFASYNFLNRVRRRVRYDELTAYRPTRYGSWVPFVGKERIRTADIELGDFHRLIVNHAPKALGAKRLKGGLTPPGEPMESLLIFDTQGFISTIIGESIICLPFILLAHAAGLVFLASTLLGQMYRLLDLGGRLTLDSVGMKARWPWQSREIRWSEATAIFCEKIGKDRRFVVTSADTSITLPRHMAHDKEVMRMVLHSLPSGTLCVGFDDSIKSGWRRGRRRRINAPATPALDPAFGTGF